MSPAPQAVPQAAGFSSGLSPAPQAVPQAAAAAVSFFVFHPKRFESAINVYLRFYLSKGFPLCDYYCNKKDYILKVRTNLLLSYFLVTSILYY